MAKPIIDILTLKPSECIAAIKAAIPTKRAIFLWGAPGISKSNVSQQVATSHDMAFIDLRLSQMDPSDLRGIPYPTKIGGVEGVRWSAPYVLPRDLDISMIVDLPAIETDVHFANPVGSNGIHYCTDPNIVVTPVSAPKGVSAKIVSSGLDRAKVVLHDAKDNPVEGKVHVSVTGKSRAIIGLEEFNSAPPSVQAAAYQFVLDRRLGEYVVPEGVYIMGMGNRDTDRGVTFKMPSPIANRFLHIEMSVDFDDWQRWALGKGIHPDVVGYLSAFKQHLFQFEAATASRGFATPRSWEFVSDILKANPDASEKVLIALIAGAIGDGLALQFNEHRAIAKDLPKAEDILSGKVKELPKKPEISLAFALTTTLCYELRDREQAIKAKGGANWKKHPDREQWLKEADAFLTFIMRNFSHEICVMGAKAAISIHKLTFETQRMPSFADFTAKFKHFLIG